jgi:hypothetical protein
MTNVSTESLGVTLSPIPGGRADSARCERSGMPNSTPMWNQITPRRRRGPLSAHREGNCSVSGTLYRDTLATALATDDGPIPPFVCTTPAVAMLHYAWDNPFR